jgi:CHAT domain-containing protein
VIQAALPPDAALLGWLDLRAAPKAHDPNGEHWAVLLRSAGDPIFARLKGSGLEDAWTEADTRLPAQLRTALQSARGDWQPLARRLCQQRLQPLLPHLAGRGKLPAVKHLIVLPSTALPGVPVEVFAESYTVSYALSGTFYAYLRKQPKPDSQSLLALGDPVFDVPAVTAKPLPPGGVLLTVVAPGSKAARARLQANDVLLRYGDTELKQLADLLKALSQPGSKGEVPVTVWREGKTFVRRVQAGKLGVVLARQPAPKALAERRKQEQQLASALRGGDKWDALPGTRAEVEALRRLFEGKPRLLFDSQASEQRLDELAASGELAKYRYVHLATHGIVDDRFPLNSAVILARDTLPDPNKQLDAGLPVYRGRLTARAVLERWHLKSELVTLSACQTALGKYERGEGFVGFAQALILAGSRSVCLSLWKVDDAATALLMERFYQNLLGKRAELKRPLSKAQALGEAKDWLRQLSREEALKRMAGLTQGVVRGKGRKALPPLPAPPGKTKEDRPYAHPYYWAAFVLLGDPD